MDKGPSCGYFFLMSSVRTLKASPVAKRHLVAKASAAAKAMKKASSSKSAPTKRK